jgi:hypothetical protein
MLSGETLAYNMFLFKSLPYDPEKNFVPITNFFFTTTAVVGFLPFRDEVAEYSHKYTQICAQIKANLWHLSL